MVSVIKKTKKTSLMILSCLDFVHNDRVTDEIEAVVQFMNKQLFDSLGDELGILVDFELNSDLPVDGFCTQDDDYDYTVEVNSKLRGKELQLTVMHELIHVYQYITGSLYQEHIEGLGPRMVWHGEDMTSTEYNDRPWEIEAERMENELYDIFAKAA